MSLAEDYAGGAALSPELVEREREVAAHMRRNQHIRAAGVEGLSDVLHAYSYEALPDGSALVLWADETTSPDADAPISVQRKAFKDMTEASGWDPRVEHSGWSITAQPTFELNPEEPGLL